MHKNSDRSISYRIKGKQRINQEFEVRILYAEHRVILGPYLKVALVYWLGN